MFSSIILDIISQMATGHIIDGNRSLIYNMDQLADMQRKQPYYSVRDGSMRIKYQEPKTVFRMTHNDLVNLHLDDLIMSEMTLSDTLISNCTFNRTDLRNTEFSYCKLRNSKFLNSNLIHFSIKTAKKEELSYSSEIAITQNEKLIAIPKHHKIQLYSFPSMKIISQFTSEVDIRINCLMFSPNNTHLATALDNGNIYIWNTNSMESEYTLNRYNCIKSLKYSPDGKFIVLSSMARGKYLITVWDCTLKANTYEKELDRLCTSFSMLPDKQLLAAGFRNSQGGKATVFHIGAQELLNVRKTGLLGVNTVVLIPNSCSLAIGLGNLGSGGKMLLWDYVSSIVMWEVQVDYQVNSISLFNGRKFLCIQTGNATLCGSHYIVNLETEGIIWKKVGKCPIQSFPSSYHPMVIITVEITGDYNIWNFN